MLITPQLISSSALFQLGISIISVMQVYLYSQKSVRNTRKAALLVYSSFRGGGGWAVTALFMVLFAQRGSTRALSAWIFIGGPDAAA